MLAVTAPLPLSSTHVLICITTYMFLRSVHILVIFAHLPLPSDHTLAVGL